ncbi:hypothetical protein NON42_001217 [Campylobacter coli]|uniref:hypothetical protein n=1 Tax=Campylobacter coli TaxID=195 RepID=UPI00127A085A|nr:hypothetical protein [Campylobacter coli]EAK0212315.1 hypothetical protein [Campylobacter jejuni]EAK2897043.1 hypothetical protein [Campylobacter coli]EAL4587016.1 hypothetical protein [Campylobacter coli]ECZ3447513.1 hypothetical protein [Campylobacter coli]
MELNELISKLSLDYNELSKLSEVEASKLLFKQNDNMSCMLLSIFSIFVEDEDIIIPKDIKDKMFYDKVNKKFNILSLILDTLHKGSVIKVHNIDKDTIHYKFDDNDVMLAINEYIKQTDKLIIEELKKDYDRHRENISTEELAYNEIQTKIEYLESLLKKENNETK